MHPLKPSNSECPRMVAELWYDGTDNHLQTTTTSSKITAATSSSTSVKSTGSSTSANTGSTKYTTTTAFTVASHAQSAYPAATAGSCGDWTLVDNVCCPLYCSNNNESSSCDSSCTGECVTPSSADCKSGTMWGETFHVNDTEEWHYSVGHNYLPKFSSQ